MMKINFAKFILVLALALVGMNACYPSDYECADNNEVIFKVIKETGAAHKDAPTQESSSDSDTHYCLCSMTCHTMFLSQSSFENFTYVFFNFPKEFQYTPQFYPQVTSSLEKPPTV